MMKIGEVARQVDLPTSTIRYYEKIGILPIPARESGQRNYKENSVDLLKVIKMARSLGFSLTEIKPLLDAFQTKDQPSNVCKEITHRKMVELDELINKMIEMKSALAKGLDCECTDVCECYLHPQRSGLSLVSLTQPPTYPKPVRV